MDVSNDFKLAPSGLLTLARTAGGPRAHRRAASVLPGYSGRTTGAPRAYCGRTAGASQVHHGRTVGHHGRNTGMRNERRNELRQFIHYVRGILVCVPLPRGSLAAAAAAARKGCMTALGSGSSSCNVWKRCGSVLWQSSCLSCSVRMLCFSASCSKAAVAAFGSVAAALCGSGSRMGTRGSRGSNNNELLNAPERHDASIA